MAFAPAPPSRVQHCAGCRSSRRSRCSRPCRKARPRGPCNRDLGSTVWLARLRAHVVKRFLPPNENRECHRHQALALGGANGRAQVGLRDRHDGH